MAKNIQIPFAFFRDVFRLVTLLEYADVDDMVRSLCKSLDFQISEKLEAIKKHDSFTAYKTAPHGSVERESLRREYLDRAGIHKDWRSDEEISSF